MHERMETIWGAWLLRFSLGMLFFVAGLNKFIGGLAGARQGIVAAGGWLPVWSVQIFATVLPFAEVGIGALLILGLLRVVALVLGSLLMLTLTFGTMVTGKSPVVANNMLYLLMFAAALFASRWDVIALDWLVFKSRHQLARG